jgi:hypothetical protein
MSNLSVFYEVINDDFFPKYVFYYWTDTHNQIESAYHFLKSHYNIKNIELKTDQHIDTQIADLCNIKYLYTIHHSNPQAKIVRIYETQDSEWHQTFLYVNDTDLEQQLSTTSEKYEEEMNCYPSIGANFN